MAVTVEGDAILGDQRHEQIEALRLLDQRDQHRHAADHDDHAPRHPLDRLAIVRRPAEDEDGGAEERAHADVDVEGDDADDQRRDDGDRDPVAPFERSIAGLGRLDGSDAQASPDDVARDTPNSFRPPNSA